MSDTGHVVKEEGTALAVRETPAALTLVPQVTAVDLKQRLDVIKEAMRSAMEKDVDYGNIPGTDKPALLKPGAEKLSVLFQLDVQLENEKVWGPDDHLTVMSRATVYHAPSGARLGFGEGLCTTREKKYAYRNAEAVCPECGEANIRRSKPRDTDKDEPGWYCWKKTGGCGTNFVANDQRITGQTVGRVENPDLPDSWNTVVKMAEKRARVDAVLSVTGASALFTQDIEEQQEPAPPLDPTTDTRPLTKEAREHVLQAVLDQGVVVSVALGACGILTSDHLTVGDSHKLRRYLDSLGKSDVPSDVETIDGEAEDDELGRIANEVFGPKETA